MVYAVWFLTGRLSLPVLWNYLLVFLFSLAAAILLCLCFCRVPILNRLFGLADMHQQNQRS
ncbi:hypothetical protein DXA36_17540 [Eisenbergiella sp. OF01-20]|nr:hypothetical protein DXA36_17540 [Eisenbergiella sp. OF01-20]